MKIIFQIVNTKQIDFVVNEPPTKIISHKTFSDIVPTFVKDISPTLFADAEETGFTLPSGKYYIEYNIDCISFLKLDDPYIVDYETARLFFNFSLQINGKEKISQSGNQFYGCDGNIPNSYNAKTPIFEVENNDKIYFSSLPRFVTNEFLFQHIRNTFSIKLFMLTIYKVE
jgi:hypothetical protein